MFLWASVMRSWRFAEIAEKEDVHKKSHEQFGKCIKLGVHEESTNRVMVAELLLPDFQVGRRVVRRHLSF